jgi:oligoribonuclease
MRGNMSTGDNLVWIDLEMTGLDPDSDRIIEIATIVTNRDLDVLAEGPVIAIHQPESVLELMDDWNRTTHGASGLLQRVRSSASSEREAEMATLEFLARRMPELERFFHYRNLDVSSLKELARRWAPDVLAGFTKKSAHLALDDIRDSIAELRYYRRNLMAEPFRGPQ